ncbi:hypothetical protein [Saccharopolyspora sp. NPDC050642]|uniref:hypothetical protein n=1 Tax=Saccharopolyspora sp. NPDC050642 TaxID=3157099 RepID=UPI0033C683D9
MAANLRSRELLRRPVVVDLLIRGGVQGVPFSDFDAMQQVWTGLVRRNGATDQGIRMRVTWPCSCLPPGVAGRRSARRCCVDRPGCTGGVEEGRLLRTSQDNPFCPVPEFAHDEVRRYAVARLLLANGDPVKGLVDTGVPRWALGAALLACQALFVAPGSASNPTTGRFVRWQDKFDELVAAGHGERWTDVPGEALLTLGDPRPVLREAWPQLQAAGQAGVQRLIRLVDQRLRGENTFVRVPAVEPLVELLLEDETPWQSSKGERTLLLEWLRSLVGSDAPAGYALREQLRARLMEFCAAADERLRAEEKARAAITDEQRAAMWEARKNVPIFGEMGGTRGAGVVASDR